MSLQHQAKFDALIVAKGGATFDTAENPKHFPPRLELEPTHLAFDLFFDLENKCVSGTQTTTVKANRNGVGENPASGASTATAPGVNNNRSSGSRDWLGML